MDARRFAPATTRNRDAICDVLCRWTPPKASVLEIASGTGEHAVHLAPRLGVERWQPTDPDPEARRSIEAWRIEAGVPAVLPPLELDVTALPWPDVGSPNVVVCVNMVHISPWSATLALFDGAERVLPESGVLYLYGPYRRAGHVTAPSNEAFDASLRARNPAWGLRDLDEVLKAAAARRLRLAEVVEMPANNLSVVLQKKSS